MTPDMNGRRRAKQPRDPILQRMMEAEGCRSEAALCQKLHIAPFYRRRQRGQPDVPDWLLRRMEERGWDGDWLRTGQGNPRREALRVDQLPPVLQAIVATAMALSEEQRETVAGCASILSQFQQDPISAASIMNTIRATELWIKEGEGMTRDVPRVPRAPPRVTELRCSPCGDR